MIQRKNHLTIIYMIREPLKAMEDDKIIILMIALIIGRNFHLDNKLVVMPELMEQQISEYEYCHAIVAQSKRRVRTYFSSPAAAVGHSGGKVFVQLAATKWAFHNSPALLQFQAKCTLINNKLQMRNLLSVLSLLARFTCVSPMTEGLLWLSNK